MEECEGVQGLYLTLWVSILSWGLQVPTSRSYDAQTTSYQVPLWRWAILFKLFSYKSVHIEVIVFVVIKFIFLQINQVNFNSFILKPPTSSISWKVSLICSSNMDNVELSLKVETQWRFTSRFYDTQMYNLLNSSSCIFY